MEQPKDSLLDRLVETARELPEDKLMEVVDFAGYLQSQYSRRQPERGSPGQFCRRWSASDLYSSSQVSWTNYWRKLSKCD